MCFLALAASQENVRWKLILVVPENLGEQNLMSKNLFGKQGYHCLLSEPYPIKIMGFGGGVKCQQHIKRQ
jgi:hypothetical protein